MKAKTKKWISTAAIGTVAMTTLAGCGGAKDPATTPSAGASTAATAQDQKPLDLSIMLPIFKTNFPKDDGPVVTEIEKKTNTNIHLEWVPNSSYADKFNITLASGKLPHILYVGDVKNPSFVNARNTHEVFK